MYGSILFYVNLYKYIKTWCKHAMLYFYSIRFTIHIVDHRFFFIFTHIVIKISFSKTDDLRFNLQRPKQTSFPRTSNLVSSCTKDTCLCLHKAADVQWKICFPLKEMRKIIFYPRSIPIVTVYLWILDRGWM